MTIFNIHNYPTLKSILLSIYKKTLRALYIKIISPRIEKNSSDFISKIIKRIKSRQKKIIFNFREYESIDLVSIYQGLKLGAIKRGYKTENLEFNLLNFGNYVSNKYNVKKNYSEYENSLIKLKKQCKKFNQINLYYALVDTLHKHHYQIWKNSFNGSFVVKDDFFNQIKKFQKKISKVAKNSDAIFFPDSSFIHNQIIKQEFLNKEKKAIVLSPSAGFYDCKNIYLSETSGEKTKDNVLQYKKHKKKISKYINERFKGKLIGDYNNIAFKDLHFKKKINNNTKVLFLHSFTDANNQSWDSNQLFARHFEWTEYTFKQLSKINFKNWFIKVHPVSQFSVTQDQAFRNQAFGNEQILSYLKKKYKIPPHVFSDCPNTLEILSKKVPIYSNSSTIVYESVIHGYKTYFTGSRFDKYFGVKILTKKEWKKVLFKKNKKLKNKISKDLLMQSKYILWDIGVKHKISKFSPDGYIFSWDGNYQVSKLAVRFLIKMVFGKNIVN